MSRTRKMSSFILAIVFGFLTFGLGFAFPAFMEKSIGKVERVAAVDYSANLTDSGMEQDANGFYKIESVENLKGVAYAIAQGKTDWASGNYVLANDLNLGDAFWTPIGTASNPFVGKFNGNGHTIQGIISIESSSMDQYVGLFGYVGGDVAGNTAIYDLVIGNYSFTPSYSNDYTTAGRLAGYVRNTVLADIYDWQYLQIPTSLNYQTIGTLDSGVTIYGGNSFVLATASTDSTGGWSYELKTPSNYKPTGHGFQFGYGAMPEQPTIAGSSIYIVDDEIGYFYKKDDTSKTELGGVRILKDLGGVILNAKNNGIISDKYVQELPTILGESGTSSVILAPVGTGKKPAGYVEDVNATTTPIKTISGYNGDGPLYVKWKDLSYNISISYDSTTVSIGTFGYNTAMGSLKQLSGDNFLKTIEAKREGFSLSGLKYNNGQIYSATFSWTEAGDRTVENENFYSNNTLTRWDGEGTVNITLQAEWVSAPVNFNISFSSQNDPGASLSVCGIASAIYQDESIEQNYDVEFNKNQTDSNKYDIRALSGVGLKFNITVPEGYKITGVVSGNNATYDSADNILTVSEATVNDNIVLNVEREIYSVEINAENFESIVISGGGEISSAGNNKWQLSVKVGEIITLTATPKSGYKFQGATYVVQGQQNPTELTLNVNELNNTVQVTVNDPIPENAEILITAEAQTIKASLVNHKDEYSTQAQNTGSVTLINGEEQHTWAGNGSWSNMNAPGEDGIEINITNTYYYKINLDQPGATNGLKITTDYDGENEAKGVTIVCETSTTTPQETTNYKITGIQAGGTYYFQVYWAKQTYTATSGVGATSSTGGSDFSTNIPGANGKNVEDKTRIVTNVLEVNNVVSNSYNPLDTLTFTYDVVSQYYEFAGWYYKNGDAYVLVSEGGNIFGNSVTISGDTISFTAPAQNVEVFVAVTGKTATVSLPADATHYYEYKGGIVDASKALSTTNPSDSITFKYGNPTSGSFSITMGAGYNLSKVIIGPSTASLADLNADDFHDFGTDLNYNGYQTIQSNSELLKNIFIDGGAKIYVLASPKTATLNFSAGEGTGSAEPITYHFGIPEDITDAVNAFSKTGYTANGWEINISGNDQTLTDPSDATSSLYYKTADGRYMLNLSAGWITDINVEESEEFTLKRTYTANKYSLTLDAGDGTFGDGVGKHVIPGITYGLSIDQPLETPTRTGYTFGGWQIGDEEITESTTWTWEENQTATAIWKAKKYTVNLNLNGGNAGGETVLPLPLEYDTGIGGNETFEGLDGMVARQGFTLQSLVLLSADNKSVVLEIVRGDEAKTFNAETFTTFDFDNSSSITLYVRWAFADDAVNATFNSNDTSITYNASLQEITNIITISENKTVIDPVTEWQYSKTGLSGWKALPEGVEGLATSLKVKNVADSGYYKASLILTDSIGPSILRDSKTINFAVDGVVPNKHIVVSPAQLLSFDNVTAGVLSGDGEKQFYEVVKYLYNIPAIQNMVKEAESDEALIASFDSGVLNSYETFNTWLTSGEYDKKAYVAKIFLSQLVLNTELRNEYLQQFKNNASTYSQEEIQFIESKLNSLVSDWGESYLSSSLENQDLLEKYVKVIFELGGSSFNYTTDFNATGNYWYDNLSIVSTFGYNTATSQASISDRFTILPISGLTGDDNIVTDASKLTENTNAGLHEVVIKITPQEGFDPSNFEGISEINGEYYIVLTKDYLAKVQAMPDQEGYEWSGIHAPILYPSITVAQMPVSRVVGNGEKQKYEVSVDLTDDTNGKYTEAYLYIETSSDETGRYTFLNDQSATGRLLVTSYELYVSGSSADKASAVYYVFTRQGDGSYSITETHGAGITNSDPVLADVSLFVDGDLEILDNADENIETLAFQTVELSVNADNNKELSGSITPSDSGYSIKVNTVSVNGTAGTFTVNISAGVTTTANYYREGNAFYDKNKTLLFQVNDLANPSIVYFNTSSGYDLTSINVTSTNPSKQNYYFVGFRQWIENQSLGDMATELKSLSNWASSTTQSISPVSNEGKIQSATYSAVYTNASWVTFDAKTDANQSFGFTPSSFFATIGSTVSFDDYDNSIDYNVYTFDGFGKNESSKEVTVADAPNQTFTAVIGLEAPKGVTITGQNFAAQLEGDLDLSTLAEHVTITNNGSAHGITYTYKWYDSDPSVEGASPIESIPANASSNGTYYVVVTATKTGFASETAQASFIITFEKTTLSLTAPTESLKQTYKNEDFRNDITIGVALANDQASDLPTYPAGISLSAILSDSTLGSILDVTIQKQTEEGAWGDVADGIINAGTYQITVALKLDVNVGNAYEYALGNNSITFDFTVTKKAVEINAGPGEGTVTTSDDTGVDDGMLFSKSLDYNSDANRVYPVNVAVDGITGVNQITLNLKRADDKQTAGNYKLVINEDATYTALSANYDISIIDNTWFRILPSSGGLQAIATVVKKADQENGIVDNTRIYNGADHSSTVRIEKAEIESDVYEFQLVTYLVYNGEGGSNNVEWARYSLVLQTVSDEDGTLENIDITDLDTSFFDGWTFTLVSGANVDSYIISCSGTNASYPSFEFIGGTTPTLEIVKKELTISSISMEYNGNSSFTLNTEDSKNEGNAQKFVVDGLIVGEDLNVTITFSNSDLGTYTYGDAKNWLDASLSDGTPGLADNYSLNLTGVSGQIIQSTKQLNLAMANNSFGYGQDGFDKPTLEGDLDSLIEKLGFSVTIGSGEATKTVDPSLYTIHIVSITPEETMAKVYSNATYLKAGKYVIAVQLTSNYYTVVDSVTGNDNATNEFTLTVNPKDITAKFDGPITKAYDGDNGVEQEKEISLSGIIGSDVVTPSATYDDKNVGTDKVVTIAISGDDAGNYNLTNEIVSGEITDTQIVLNIDLGNDFVDGQNASITGNVISFTINYNQDLNASGAMSILTSPTKPGYTFKDWAVGVQGGSGTIGGLENGTILSSDNIMAFVDTLREANQYFADIYATWDIDKYTLTINDSTNMGKFEISITEGSGSQTGSTAPSGDLEKGTWTYTYTYYTEVTITRLANSGYFLTGTPSETFRVVGAKSIDVTNNDFRPANITIEISIDPDSYHGGEAISFENTGEDVWTVSSYRAQTTLTSQGLISTNLQTYFARTVLDGYTFSGWSYKNADSEKVKIEYDIGDELLLSAVVADIYSSYTDDITISFTAILTANKYELSFDANGGTLGESTQKITVTYGKAINETLPTPARAGYVFSGWQIEGETITTDTVWKWAENKIAVAVWTDGDYDLTVTVTLTDNIANSNANVTISYINEQGGTSYVVDEDEADKTFKFTLNRGITYTIKVTTNKGYNVEWGANSDFDLEGSGNERTITNIINNSTLGITIYAMTHEVTITGLTNATYEVKVDGTAPSISSDKFNASTEQTIVVTLTPSAGYSVTGNATVTAGAQISKSKNQFTITDFNDNITINFANVVSANSYDATIKFNKNEIKVAGLTGTSQSENDFITFTTKVTTSGELVFYIQDLHGYNYSDIQRTGTVTVNVDESPMEDGTYAGYRKVTVSGYTQTFGLEIKTTKVKFDVNASIVAVDSEFNIMQDVQGISVEKATQQIEYLTNATVEAINNNPAYAFDGWYDASVVGDGSVNIDDATPLSTVLEYTFTVEDNISLVAVFKYQTYNVEVRIEYTERATDGVDHATITVNDIKNLTSWNATMSYDDELEVTAVVDAGYKVVGWYIGAVDDSTEGEGVTYTTTITGELTLILVVDAEDLPVEIVPKVIINGVAYSGADISELAYGTIELGTYSNGVFTPTDNLTEQNDFSIDSYTGGTLYLRLSAKEGYRLDTLYNIAGDPTFSPIGEDSGYKIYRISNLNSENTYQIEARFIAISTPINIVFSDGQNRLEAGRITVTTSAGLNIVQNNSHNVTVNAITGSKVEVTASITFGQMFVDQTEALNNIKITSNSGTILDPTITTPNASTGWSAQLSFEITEFTGTPLVEILVTPKSYNVQLVGWDGDEIGEPFAVTYGAPIVLPEGLTISPRDGFALLGFYKYANGVGTRYIDGDLNPIGNWTDNGYQRNSEGVYVVSANFNADTFRIFASYSINKARLQIDVVPPGLEDVPPTVAAKIVVLGTTTANSWSSSLDSSFVEVREGATITLQAPVYENYKFGYWTIVRTTKNGVSRQETVASETIENFEHDGYSLVNITLTYFAKVSVKATTGGTASYTYFDGTEQVVVTDSEYIPTTNPIKLNATAQAGYKFVGWFVGGQLRTMEPNYEYSASLTEPLSPTEFEARFESETFKMKIDVQNPESISLKNVTVGGEQVNFENSFDVKLGQVVIISLNVSDGLTIAWEGGKVSPLINSYIYTVSYDDVLDGAINLKAYVSYKQCDVNISVNVINGNETDKTLAAIVYYKQDDDFVQIRDIIKGVTITRVIGSALEFKIDLRQNYRYENIIVDGQDSGAVLEGNIVRISVNPKNLYANSIDVQINFARDYWIDYVDEENFELTGSGTDSDPYIISTINDLSYVAYMINVTGSKEYANAVYVLGDNIDLTGKFWSPIGTEENKFNGKFYYRNFQIVGARPVRDYQGDISSDYVFGFVTDNAEFELPQGDWIIAVIIVSIILLLIIIALIIFFVLRKKRKKKLEQLANS